MQERIIPNILVTATGCWEWQGYCAKTGYGEINVSGQRWYVHRLVCTLYHGTIGKEMVARHLCNNRKCCNPEHVVIGTRSENAHDAYKCSRKKRSIQRRRKPNYLAGEDLINWVYENMVTEDAATGCWITNNTTNEYTWIRAIGKAVAMHRYVYCVRSSMDYDGTFVVRHICHRKSCVNPDHLIHGTQRDNSLDSRANYKHVKLTPEQVIAVATSYRDTVFAEFGVRDQFISRWAEQLDVSYGAIMSIVTGKSWSDLTKAILDAKIAIWRPRLPSTRFNPDIIREVKADMGNWDFDKFGQRIRFDEKWAAILLTSRGHIASIRKGYRWPNVLA